MHQLRNNINKPFLNSTNLETIMVEVMPDSILRPEAELFVKQCFKREYDADVTWFLERLIASYEKGVLTSVVGFNAAQNNSFYLEQYLNSPVEDTIQNVIGQVCHRSEILEVGNLASQSQGSFRRLVFSLTQYFSNMNYQWVVFTAIPTLINTFDKYGIELVSLGEANPESLKGDASLWGRYYEKSPKVVAANIGKGMSHLTSIPVMRKMLERAPIPEMQGW